jgi:hypothetical protein
MYQCIMYMYLQMYYNELSRFIENKPEVSDELYGA